MTAIPILSVYNILRQQLNKYPNRLQMQHELLPTDYTARKNFATWFLNNIFHSIDSIFWSDESYFYLGGGTHNAIIWVDEKPSHIISKPLYPKKVCVWIGFTSKFMLDSIIFDEGTIKGQRYFELIRDNIIS